MLKNAHIWSMYAALMRALARWLGCKAIESNGALFQVPHEEEFKLAVELFARGQLMWKR